MPAKGRDFSNAVSLIIRSGSGVFALSDVHGGPAVKKMTRILLMIIAAVSIAAGRQPVPGGDSLRNYSLSPVIITPTAAVERESPVTFSNLSAEAIEVRSAGQDAPEMLSQLPSTTHFSFNGNDIGYTFMNLRGFDQRRLSVMVNGIPQNDPEDHEVYWIDLPNLLGFTQNIQVQRGAGSAFYGPPAIGGSINIVTMPLTLQPRVSVESGFEYQQFGDEQSTRLNTRTSDLSVSSGIVGSRYLFYGRLGRTVSGGYRDVSWADLSSYYVGAVRFDESMTTRVNLYGGPISDGEAYYGVPKYYNGDLHLRRANYSYWAFDTTGARVDPASVVRQKPQSVEGFSQPHYEILNDWKLSPAVTLHNTMFYIQGDGYFDYDGDWIPYDGVATDWFRRYVGYDTSFGSSVFPSFVIRGFVGNKQGGWLPRVEWDHGSGRLTLGGELRIHRSVHWGKITSASQLPSALYDPDFHFYEYNGEKDMTSLYAHELFHPDDATTVMADVQLARDRYGIRNEKYLGNTFDIDYFFLNPHLGINRNFSDQLNGYASLSYTSREPRLRNLYPAEDAWFGGQPQFASVTGPSGSVRYLFDRPFSQPEHILDLEVGGSAASAAGKVSAALYWMEFRDELIKSGKIDIFGESILLNARRTRHVGIEIQATERPLEGMELEGNVSASTNRIIDHSFPDPVDSVERSLDGNPIAGFPDILANARITYGRSGSSLSVLLRYVGSFHTDNLDDPQNTVDASTVADVDATIRIPSPFRETGLAVRGKVRNLFNRLYLAGGEGSAFFPAAERSFFIGLKVDW